eukprot:TRINITY_DN9541_c0_g1_i1.p1 TRINITY_DN9541_c0_g1~~TRINITY_DN9541_c0_g1_i1.p1  ORF type:complete len:241 (+),score=26.48 TRINITY_DN9541_c0_g1_i1:127-849(+)
MGKAADCRLSVVHINGEEKQIDGLSDDSPLQVLKAKVAEVTGVACREQLLLLGSRTLDQDSSLSSLGVSDGSQLTLVRRAFPLEGTWVGFFDYSWQGHVVESRIDLSSWTWLDEDYLTIEVPVEFSFLDTSLSRGAKYMSLAVCRGTYDWDSQTCYLIQVAGCYHLEKDSTGGWQHTSLPGTMHNLLMSTCQLNIELSGTVVVSTQRAEDYRGRQIVFSRVHDAGGLEIWEEHRHLYKAR